jgi:hypothetical protein
MVKHGRTMCEIAHHVIFVMLMVKLTLFWLLSLLAFGVCCMNNLKGHQLCWSCVINVQEVNI